MRQILLLLVLFATPACRQKILPPSTSSKASHTDARTSAAKADTGKADLGASNFAFKLKDELGQIKPPQAGKEPSKLDALVGATAQSLEETPDLAINIMAHSDEAELAVQASTDSDFTTVAEVAKSGISKKNLEKQGESSASTANPQMTAGIAASALAAGIGITLLILAYRSYHHKARELYADKPVYTVDGKYFSADGTALKRQGANEYAELTIPIDAQKHQNMFGNNELFPSAEFAQSQALPLKYSETKALYVERDGIRLVVAEKGDSFILKTKTLSDGKSAAYYLDERGEEKLLSRYESTDKKVFQYKKMRIEHTGNQYKVVDGKNKPYKLDGDFKVVSFNDTEIFIAYNQRAPDADRNRVVEFVDGKPQLKKTADGKQIFILENMNYYYVKGEGGYGQELKYLVDVDGEEVKIDEKNVEIIRKGSIETGKLQAIKDEGIIISDPKARRSIEPDFARLKDNIKAVGRVRAKIGEQAKIVTAEEERGFSRKTKALSVGGIAALAIAPAIAAVSSILASKGVNLAAGTGGRAQEIRRFFERVGRHWLSEKQRVAKQASLRP